MTDFARKPARCQAVLLPYFWTVVRRICYTLAQKAIPPLHKAQNPRKAG